MGEDGGFQPVESDVLFAHPGIDDGDLKCAVTNIGVHGDQPAEHRARFFGLADASEQVAKRRQRAALFALHTGGGSIGCQSFGKLTLALVRGAKDDIGAAVIPLEADG